MKYKKYLQRDPIKNYFPLPNEIFCLGLCSGELSVYSYLLYREDRKTFQCWPSYKTIGAATNMSRNTVRKYVEMLEQKHFITTEYTQVFTKNGKKYNGNLKYTIRPIDEAVEYYHQFQLEKLAREQAKAEAKRRLDEYDRKRGYKVG
ncbi:MAG: helix-turn-helix domain-containing protein [Oscillospiraceae bacterium]|nr:helix-turn-helix domain-containing protein [Oscillospiraceae bacterium]HCA29811.1 helix-turn-helix domain-containing protein [Oscillospiraceae bacterium]